MNALVAKDFDYLGQYSQKVDVDRRGNARADRCIFLFEITLYQRQSRRKRLYKFVSAVVEFRSVRGV